MPSYYALSQPQSLSMTTFLDIRLLILAYVIYSYKVISFSSKIQPILLVCSRLYIEALPIFFQTKIFELGYWQSIQVHRPECLRNLIHIRHLSINWTFLKEHQALIKSAFPSPQLQSLEISSSYTFQTGKLPKSIVFKTFKQLPLAIISEELTDSPQ